MGFEPTVFPPQMERDSQITLQADLMKYHATVYYELSAESSSPLIYYLCKIVHAWRRLDIVETPLS